MAFSARRLDSWLVWSSREGFVQLLQKPIVCLAILTIHLGAVRPRVSQYLGAWCQEKLQDLVVTAPRWIAIWIISVFAVQATA